MFNCLIISAMIRRIHVSEVRVGDVALDPSTGHHVRNVLRLRDAEPVEAFDDAGAIADGILLLDSSPVVRVRIQTVRPSTRAALELIVAAAIPKGERADWMVEKLSELGAATFIPLAAAHSIVLPEGKNKYERWVRIATESAGQSRRPGVMRIASLMTVNTLLQSCSASSTWYFSTAAHAPPVYEAIAHLLAAPPPATLTLLIGPEGGWSDGEIEQFTARQLTAVHLTNTILRIETAAIAAAAVIASILVPQLK